MGHSDTCRQKSSKATTVYLVKVQHSGMGRRMGPEMKEIALVTVL